MKLVIFGSKRLGCLLDDNRVVDLNYAYAILLKKKGVPRYRAKADAAVPPDLLSFIKEGDKGLEAAKEAVSLVQGGATKGPKGEKLVYDADQAEIKAPLPSLASRILMAGANFYDHSADFMSMRQGKRVTIEDVKKQVEDGTHIAWGFWKQPRNVIGPGEPLTYPDRSERLDYEVEVAAVFGRKGKDIPVEEAMDYIYGYTIVNDMSLRDQPQDNGIFRSKNFDTSVPMGPCLVTADEVGDPHKLKMRQTVNGEMRQDGTQESIIRDYPFWINFLTQDLTFYPGDMICAGTCSGTALDTTPRDVDGKTKPDNFLKPGDVIEAWVENIGFLKTPIVAKK